MDGRYRSNRGMKRVADGTFRLEFYVGGTRKRVLVNASTEDEARWLKEALIRETISAPPKKRELKLPVLGSSRRQEPWKTFVECSVSQPRSWLHQLFKQAQKNAVSRSLDFVLTFEEFVGLVVLSGGACSVTGHPFVEATDLKCRTSPFRPSLDRINSSIGYTKNNCRIVCTATNLALSDWGLRVFHRLAVSYTRRVLNEQFNALMAADGVATIHVDGLVSD